MKSAMPFHGVRMPEMRRIARALFAEASFPSRDAWVEAVLALWRAARFREERYAAIELSGDRRFREFQRPDLVPVYEELVVTGAWWDLVDPVATGRIGPLVIAYPGEAGEAMRAWARSDDLWKRRAAIVCQVTARRRTDVELLNGLHRAEPRRAGLLPPQGHRLGAARAREDGSPSGWRRTCGARASA